MITEKIFGKDTDFKRRIFYVMVLTAGFANTIGFISNAVLFGFTSGTVVCGVCAAAVILAGVFGVIMDRIKACMYFILALVNLFEFPFLFIAYGLSTMVYMILGLVGIITFITTRRRFVFVGLALLFDIGAFAIRYCFPELSQSTENMKGALICSFLIVFFAVLAIIDVIIDEYEGKTRELTEMSKMLGVAVHTDPLTGIYNRRFLMEYLDKKLDGMGEATACAMLMDIDYFKKVNDTYGHVFGDRVLVEFGKILKSRIGDKGVATRFGGEEFMIVFSISDRNEICGIMNSIRSDFAEFSQQEKGIELTFSGGGEFFDAGTTITEIFSAADKKLYAAKDNGINRIFFDLP